MELNDSQTSPFRSRKKVNSQFHFHAALHHLNKKTATRREVQHFHTMKGTKLLVQSGVLISTPTSLNLTHQIHLQRKKKRKMRAKTDCRILHGETLINIATPFSPIVFHEQFVPPWSLYWYLLFNFVCYKMLEYWREHRSIYVLCKFAHDLVTSIVICQKYWEM